MTLTERLQQFIVDNFMFGDGSGLTPSTSLVGSGTIDSTGALELVTYLEREFGVAIEDHDLTPDNLDTIDRIAAFLARKSRTVGTEAL